MRAFHRALLMLVATLTAACAFTPASTSERFQVMTYNIRCGSCEPEDDSNHWSRRQFLVADVIRKSKADLIGLQEAEAFQVKDLVTMLGEFEWVGVGRDDGKEKGEMNAFLVRRSRFAIASQTTLWLSETPNRISKGWDAMFNRTLTVLRLKSHRSGRDIYFLNTHFDHAGPVARNQSADLLAQTVRKQGPDVPVIVTGDLNDKPGFAGYQTLIAALQDAAPVALAPASGGDITFNGFGEDMQPGNKIDYVFVSPVLQVYSHHVVTDLYDGQYASDHYPIVVEMGLH